MIRNHLKELYRGVAYGGSRTGKLRLDLNESVEGLPEPFVREVLDSVDAACLSMYPDSSEVVGRLARDLSLSEREIILGNGSDSSISDIFLATMEPGDKLLCTDPTFAMYPVYGAIHQAEVATVSYGPDFVFPFTAFMDALDASVRMAVIVNPNNPTGSVLEHEKIRELAVKAKACGTLLLVDEAYYPYLGQTSVGLVREFDNVLVTRTFSKLHGMAALRLGYVAGCAALINGIHAVRPTFDVNGIALLFAKGLLDRPDILDAALAQVDEGRRWLANRLDTMGVSYKAGATNYMLIDCGEHPVEIAREMERLGVLVASGFRQDFMRKYLRVTLGGKETMARFLDAFQRARAAVAAG